MSATTAELIQRARALISTASGVLALEGGESASGQAVPTSGPAADLLGLYEQLRGRLDAIDTAEINELLSEISETVDGLGRLAEDLGRVGTLRSALIGPDVGDAGTADSQPQDGES